MHLLRRTALFPLCIGWLTCAFGRDLAVKPDDPELAPYRGWVAPAGGNLVKGDRLAICGDSITEQKMYSVMMETYLAACLPELEITCRQYGWSGEQASGFLNRMKNDVLRFQPTIATTCYGMNDHRYVPYTEEIGANYRKHQTAVVKTFQEAGVRVVLGSPGTIDSVPGWVKSASGTKQDLNLSLNRLRDIDIEIAEDLRCGFADVYWPMLIKGHEAKKRHGPDFMLSGKDGVHPGWAGQVAMAMAFLQGLGAKGDLGSITVDLGSHTARGAGGHEAAWKDGAVEVRSARWPFVITPGAVDRDDQMAAGAELMGFQEALNRLTLVVTGAKGENVSVEWGGQRKTFPKARLEAGILLPREFPENPFSEPFKKLMDAVQAKQAYETRQIKEIVHGREGAADMEMAFALTEKTRAPLAAAVARAFKPLQHRLVITSP